MGEADPRFGESEVDNQSVAILRAWGFPDETARIAASVLTYADLSGIDSHGISMFLGYEQLFRDGELNTAATPTVVRENPCTALVDGQAGLGHPVAVAGMELAIDKAAACGIGAVSVRNSHHFGAAGYYSALAADRGYLGIVTTSARTAAVTPTGGARPRLSTNPLSFAAPGRHNEPFVLDMSTSTVAINKIKVYELNGWPLPAGWYIDPDGAPVTDAGAALRAAREGLGGGLSPLGGARESSGHKGYGLSLMVQILSSALSGGNFAALRSPTGADNIGHFLLAIDPAAFRQADNFLDDVDQVIDTMHDTEPAAPGGEVLVAGEPESRARGYRREHGIPLPSALLAELRGVCARTGAPFLLGQA